ncbi:MAG: hypothetical protein RL328_344 [Acidobacteriota bacterium]
MHVQPGQPVNLGCHLPGTVHWVWMRRLHQLLSHPIGFALSGGSVRGLAHIGVLKELSEAGLKPSVITGTSAGSLVGAMAAAGMPWQDMAALARELFWPSLLHGDRLVRFCEQHLPPTFDALSLPFAAIVTELPSKDARVITEGKLPSAISASCALRGIRRPVERDGLRLKDGGIACVLPAQACRALGAEFVIGSDVWELSSVLRRAGIPPHHPRANRWYPQHYHAAVQSTDLLIHPQIPIAGYLPTSSAVDAMIDAGAAAARQALHRLTAQAA